MTTQVWVRTAGGLAIVVALASACGGDSGPAAAHGPAATETAPPTSDESVAPEPEPVPWEAVEAAGTTLHTVWTIDTAIEPFDTGPPTDLADPSCLAGLAEG